MEEGFKAFVKVIMVFISGLVTLPYAYFNSDSAFSSQEFGIFITGFIWFTVFWGDVIIEFGNYLLEKVLNIQ